MLTSKFLELFQGDYHPLGFQPKTFSKFPWIRYQHRVDIGHNFIDRTLAPISQANDSL